MDPVGPAGGAGGGAGGGMAGGTAPPEGWAFGGGQRVRPGGPGAAPGRAGAEAEAVVVAGCAERAPGENHERPGGAPLGPVAEAPEDLRKDGARAEAAPPPPDEAARQGPVESGGASPRGDELGGPPGEVTDGADMEPPGEGREAEGCEGGGGGSQGQDSAERIVQEDEEGPEWEPGMEPEDSMSDSDSEDFSSESSDEAFSLSSSEESSEEEEEEAVEEEGPRAGVRAGGEPGAEGGAARLLEGDFGVAVSGQRRDGTSSVDNANWGDFLTALHEGRLLEESDSDEDLDLGEFLDEGLRVGDLGGGGAQKRGARPLTRAEGPVEDYDLDDYEAALEAAEWELTGNDRREYADFLSDFFAHAEADEDSDDDRDGDYVAKWGALELPEILTPSKRRMPSPRRAAKNARNAARPILGNINVAAKAKVMPLLKASKKSAQSAEPGSAAANKKARSSRAAAGRALQFSAPTRPLLPASALPASGTALASAPEPQAFQAAWKAEPAWTSDELAYLEEQSLSRAYLFVDTFRPNQVEELYWQMQALVQLLLQGCAPSPPNQAGEGAGVSKAKAKTKAKGKGKPGLSKKERQAAARLAASKAEEQRARVLKLWEHLQDIMVYTQWLSARNGMLRFAGVPPQTLGMGAPPGRAARGDPLQESPDPHGSEAWVPWRGRLIHFIQGVTDNTLIRKLHHAVVTQQAVKTATIGAPLDLEPMRFEEDFNPSLRQREMKRLMRNKMQLFTPAEDRLLAMGIRTLGNNYRLIKKRLLPGKDPCQINTRRRNVLQRSSNKEIKSAMADLHSKLSPELRREIQAALDKYRDLPPSSRWEMVSLSPSPLLRGHSAAVLKQMWESMMPWKEKLEEEKPAQAGPSDGPQGSLERLLEGDSESKEGMDPDWGLGVFRTAESLPGGPAASPPRATTAFEQEEMEESGSEGDERGQTPSRPQRPERGVDLGSLSAGPGPSGGRPVATHPPPRRGLGGHREGYFSQDELEPESPGAAKGGVQARPFEVGAAEREELSDSEPDIDPRAEKEQPAGFEREQLSDSE